MHAAIPRIRGFTLLELLVVTAILAVLAAILLPVLAQAREKARQTGCAANLKQLGQAVQMYGQDFDERLVPLYYNGAAGQTTPDNLGAFRWPWLVQSYCRTFAVLWCPSDRSDPAGYRDTSSPYYGYYIGLFPSYGYNSDYLSPDPDGPYGPLPESPVALAQIAEPAGTVLLADSTYSTAGTPGQPDTAFHSGFYRVGPPSTWTGAPPLTRTSFGYLWPRHNQQAEVLFCDGHVRSAPIGQMADEALWDLS